VHHEHDRQTAETFAVWYPSCLCWCCCSPRVAGGQLGRTAEAALREGGPFDAAIGTHIEINAEQIVGALTTSLKGRERR
jgi:hypothetical protein